MIDEYRIMGITYWALMIIYFFPIFYLYHFSRLVKMAIIESNSEFLASALKNLKNHFQYVGILTIISLALYIFIFFWFFAWKNFFVVK